MIAEFKISLGGISGGGGMFYLDICGYIPSDRS